MLQIISGKFFKSAERHRFPAKAVTFSTFSWKRPIITCVASLEPADLYHQGIGPYVITYTNQMEKREQEKDGSQTTWVVPDDASDVLTRLEATHGEPTAMVHFPASNVAPEDDAVGHATCRLVVQLDRLLWPQASEVADTKGFREKSHEELLQTLRQTLDDLTSLHVQTTITHSLAEAGCDATIVFLANEPKCGIQLKSYGDIKDRDFARNTLAQIQESRRHGLARLYLVLAADLTDQSQREKVRNLTSRLSQAKEDYVRVIPPERAWTLLFGVQSTR